MLHDFIVQTAQKSNLQVVCTACRLIKFSKKLQRNSNLGIRKQTELLELCALHSPTVELPLSVTLKDRSRAAKTDNPRAIYVLPRTVTMNDCWNDDEDLVLLDTIH